MSQVDYFCAVVIVAFAVYFSIRGFMKQVSYLIGWMLACQIVRVDYCALLSGFIPGIECCPSVLLQYGLPTVLAVICLWGSAILGDYLKYFGQNNGFGETDKLLGLIAGSVCGAIVSVVVLLFYYGSSAALQESSAWQQSKFTQALINRPVIWESALCVETFLNEVPGRLSATHPRELLVAIRDAAQTSDLIGNDPSITKERVVSVIPMVPVEQVSLVPEPDKAQTVHVSSSNPSAESFEKSTEEPVAESE